MSELLANDAPIFSALDKQRLPNAHHSLENSNTLPTETSCSVSYDGDEVTSRREYSPDRSDQQLRDHLATFDLPEDERKQNFVVFLRVLIKYLGIKDRQLQTRAHCIIQQCEAAHLRAGYPPGKELVLYGRIQNKLQEIITVKHWKRAQSYLQAYLRNKQSGKPKKTIY
jgi:hypothetical protein